MLMQHVRIFPGRLRVRVTLDIQELEIHAQMIMSAHLTQIIAMPTQHVKISQGPLLVLVMMDFQEMEYPVLTSTSAHKVQTIVIPMQHVKISKDPLRAAVILVILGQGLRVRMTMNVL